MKKRTSATQKRDGGTWRTRMYAHGYMRPSRYPQATSGARLIPAAVVLFFVAGGCGQYGVQIAQRNGLDAAGFTLLLSATTALAGLYLLLIAIRAIRTGRTGRDAADQPSHRGEG